MKEIFHVRKQKFLDKLVNKISSHKSDDKRVIKMLIVTDNDIIIEALDNIGNNKKIIIPVRGVISKIKETDLKIDDKMITIEYVNNLGRIQYCSFYPGLISEKEKARFLKVLKLIGIVKVDLNI